MRSVLERRSALGGLRAGLRVQCRVIAALVIRDMMMRYGRANIGFLWVILEPMILTAAIMLMWSLVKSPYEHGLAVVALVLTGYMPLTLFRHITNVGPMLYRRSVPLLYHRHITFIDVLIARTFLEFAGTTAALIVVYSVLVLADVVSPIRDPGPVMLGWALMALLSLGLASVFAVATEVSDAMERFIPPFQYLMLPLSGAFYMLDWLPTAAADIAWYMPTVHCYELFRAGFFGEDVVTHYAIWYPMAWAAALTAIGLSSIDRIRDRIHTG